MSDKKRKSTSKDSHRPNKKQQTESTTVRVTHVAGPDIAKPVVASSPGIVFPNVCFQPFVKQDAGKTNLLLRSTNHPSVDHTAREDDNSIERHLKHYIAVYDPENSALQVTEAKHLTVRTSLRPVVSDRERQDGDGHQDEKIPAADQMSRAALTAAFGTKKSKKAVQTMAENRQLAQGGGGADNPIAAAMLAHVAEDGILEDGVSLGDALSNKPLPVADQSTNEIDRVYSLDRLVLPSPAASTLEAMPVNLWTSRISAGKEVTARSRFAANRVGYLGTNISNIKAAKAIPVLRYIQLLLDIHSYVTRLPKHKAIPQSTDWPTDALSEGTPGYVLRPIVHHFFPDRRPKGQAVTLLCTTILALALHIPPPSLNVTPGTLVTDPTDLSLDMAIDATEMRKLYRELGCTLAPATDTDLNTWGLQRLAKRKKDDTGKTMPKPTFAKLKFPLKFPKVSKGAPQRRR